MQNYTKAVMEAAANSVAQKRKVGAILVHFNFGIVATGWNYNEKDPTGPCEDLNGETLPSVIHAEEACLRRFDIDHPALEYTNCIMYVSHQPCEDCRDAVIQAGVKEIRVVDTFMKFDSDKLRYDLVPPSATEALAEVLTFGAKKYKPNNWRNVEDPARYIAALERHIQAYKKGEVHDPESKLHHLAHAMTNMSFLIELDYRPSLPSKAQLRLTDK